MRAIRSYYRHLRDALRNLFRNGWMTSISIIVMSLTLFLLGTFFLLALNINQLTDAIESEIQVRVMIDPVAETADERELGEQIADLDPVIKVVYRSAEQELASYQEQITADFDVLKDINPLNNMYLVTVDSADQLESVTQQIREFKWVQSASIGTVDLNSLIQTISLLRYGIAIIGAVFVMIVVLLLSNTVKMTIRSRSREIEIMKLVGAKPSYIRAPFQIEGATIGVIGAIIASFGLYFAYQAIVQLAQDILAFNPDYAVPIYPNMIYIAVFLILLGWLIGSLAARRAVLKFLK